MLAADDESDEQTPWWPGVLGAWIFLALGFAVLMDIGGRPFDPLLSVDTHHGLSAWILDPLLRGLVPLQGDHSLLRLLYFLCSGFGILALALAMRSRLELLPLSLVLFLLGTWPWTLRDPASLLAAPHHLRLLILGLMALSLARMDMWAILAPAALGLLRQGLVGGDDWQIDMLFLFLIFSVLHGADWNSTGRHALYGLGLFAMTVFLPEAFGLGSGKVPVPVGLSGFEDTNVDFGTILLFRPGFLLLSSALIWLLLGSRPHGLARVFSSTTLFALTIVLFVSAFADARMSLAAQDGLLARDRKSLIAALPDRISEDGLLLINLPLHLRPLLLTEIDRADWGRLVKLDTWDSGSEIYLPPDFSTTMGMQILRYGPMGPMPAKPSAVTLLQRFPRARLLSHRAARFPMRLSDMVSLGKLPPYLGSQDVEPYLVELLKEAPEEEGREIGEARELPELDPSTVRMILEDKDSELLLSFETESPRSFLLAIALGRGQLVPFDVDRDPILAYSLKGEKTVLDYLLSLADRLGKDPNTKGYKLTSLQDLKVVPFAWIPGYGPVFLIHKTKPGKASFTLEYRSSS